MTDKGAMIRCFKLFAVLALVCANPVLAEAASPECMLCSNIESAENRGNKQEIPLHIEVTSKLSFSRLALTGKGDAQVAVDPASGERKLNGEIIGLGDYPAAASITLTGEPGRRLRIDIPRSITMSSSSGGAIFINDIRSTLGGAPQLDYTGKLVFSFGGKLEVKGNISGSFRGRIPITAEYE
jgi:Domain of unknown function (DUF4402)